MAWQTPKMDWNPPDGVSDADFNRIEGNTVELKKAATISIIDSANLITATDVENALQELANNIVNGKGNLASAITAMGQAASNADTMAILSNKIRAISNDANAAVGDVVAGQTFYQGGAKKTGTMTDQASYTTPVSTAMSGEDLYVRIPLGAYRAPTSIGYPEIKLASTGINTYNIKAGATIFGVAGDAWVVWTGDCENNDAAVLAGNRYYAFGVKRTGTMPNFTNGNKNVAWSNGNGDAGVDCIPPTGFYSNTTVWISDGNLVPNNIRQGVSIFGVAGGMPTSAPFASGSFATGGATSGRVELPFDPDIISILQRNASLSIYERAINYFGTTHYYSSNTQTNGKGANYFYWTSAYNSSYATTIDYWAFQAHSI